MGRWLTGQTRGIALSGGGARGFVHLGVVAAMVESGFELDLIAGTSAGAMAGGLLARAEPPEPMMENALKIIEAAGNPFVEFDLSIISMLRSGRMRAGLHGTYRKTAMEDNWIPLRIVVTDLTESRRRVFDRGLLWERVLAASSPPGIMAPVLAEGHLLCDGGLVDNLPVSVLQEHNCNGKWAAYVGSVAELPAPLSGFPTSWTLLMDKILRRKRHHDVPTLLTTLFQCLTVSAAAQLENARASADVFFQPDLSAFSVTDINAAREILRIPFIGIGYILSGHLLIDRENRNSAIKSMDAIARLVESHRISIWILPEGTRSRQGQLKPFKKGFAHLALATRLPIVPVVVHQGHRFWSGGLTVRRGRICIDILPPIRTDDWTEERLAEHIAEVEQAFRTSLAQDQLGST